MLLFYLVYFKSVSISALKNKLPKIFSYHLYIYIYIYVVTNIYICGIYIYIYSLLNEKQKALKYLVQGPSVQKTFRL